MKILHISKCTLAKYSGFIIYIMERMYDYMGSNFKKWKKLLYLTNIYMTSYYVTSNIFSGANNDDESFGEINKNNSKVVVIIIKKNLMETKYPNKIL